MSYRCELCGNASEPGQQQIKHVIKRTMKRIQKEVLSGNVVTKEVLRDEIAAEVAVCGECHVGINKVGYDIFIKRFFPTRPAAVAAQVPVVATPVVQATNGPLAAPAEATAQPKFVGRSARRATKL